MEWVEVRGEDVAAAEELALDQLGVAREDAEFEVVTAPENRWLGLKKTEARVRARVKPVGPKTKENNSRKANNRKKPQNRKNQQGNRQNSSKSAPKTPKNQEKNTPNHKKNNKKNTSQKREKAEKMEERELMPLADQEQAVIVFLDGIIKGFDLEASSKTHLEDERIIGSINGDDVGLLIGPKAGTLHALQDLARTTVQRHAAGRRTNRLSIDVGGYRERRKTSLVEFTHRQIQTVNESGESLVLEPMTSADRKIIHDAVAENDTVTSSSEGDEPRRYVIIHPANTE